VILTSFSQNYYQFVGFRLLTGVAVGGEYTAIFAAIDEMIPKINRGSVSIVVDGSWHLGIYIFDQSRQFGGRSAIYDLRRLQKHSPTIY